MCDRYASDIRKAGIEKDYYGFDEWSETRINPILGNAVLEVFPHESQWSARRQHTTERVDTGRKLKRVGLCPPTASPRAQ